MDTFKCSGLRVYAHKKASVGILRLVKFVEGVRAHAGVRTCVRTCVHMMLYVCMRVGYACMYVYSSHNTDIPDRKQKHLAIPAKQFLSNTVSTTLLHHRSPY